MYLKIMSGEDAPDGDSRKTFRILGNVAAVNFSRQGQKAVAEVTFASGPGETFFPEGNCYLLSTENGDTIASFGAAPYVRHRERD